MAQPLVPCTMPLPALLREAEAVGAVTLARLLRQALTEAESIVRRAP